MIFRATAKGPRDHLIYSLAFGTGLRLAEIVGLNVGDIYSPDGSPRSRVRIRPEIAKGGRAGDIFLPLFKTRNLPCEFSSTPRFMVQRALAPWGRSGSRRVPAILSEAALLHRR